jgi:hypothetical protein
MNRRNFITRSTTALALLTMAATFPLTACAFSVTGMLSTIISALTGVLNYVAADATWLPAVQQVLAKLQTELAAWQSGTGVIATLEQVLNDALPILALIPLTAVYAPLIGLVVAGIESIINHFGTASAKRAMYAANNPYQGMVKLKEPHFGQSWQGAFKSQFDDTAKGLGLTKAVI